MATSPTCYLCRGLDGDTTDRRLTSPSNRNEVTLNRPPGEANPLATSGFGSSPKSPGAASPGARRSVLTNDPVVRARTYVQPNGYWKDK